MPRNIWAFCVVVLMSLARLSADQPRVAVQDAELSIPFGVVSGQLIIVGDHLVFVDERSKDASFAIARSGIQSLTVDDETLSVTTKEPVRHRDGERTELQFRLKDALQAKLWFDAVAPAPVPAPEIAAAAPSIAALSYSAEHKHRFAGGCQGQLIVMEDKVVFESIDNLGHSRQWALSDIRELKLKNPYELEIRPFSGNDYNLKFLGKGMESGDFKALVQRVAASRVGP